MKYYKVSAIGIEREGMVVKTNEDGSLWVRDEAVDTENKFLVIVEMNTKLKMLTSLFGTEQV